MTPFGGPGGVAEPGRTPERTFAEERWGLQNKAEGIIRFGFNNINGMGTRQSDLRNKELYGFIKSGEFDIFGMTETNVAWKNNPEHIKDIMHGWFRRMSVCYEYYRAYPGTATFQVGGVAQIAVGDITSRMLKHGGDSTGQGRWTWHQLKGKKERIVRVITAYRPVKNCNSAGSVWNQHQHYADTHRIEGNPQSRWIDDLVAELRIWIQQGESIILLVDLNDNVVSGKASAKLREVGLSEKLTSTHNMQIPTYQRGSAPIDGIFTTKDIVTVQCGYVSSMSDHLCLWMDMEVDKLFDNVVQVLPAVQRRLQCSDPRLTKRYGKRLWTTVQEAQIHERNRQLCNDSIPIRIRERTWEKLDRQLLQMRLEAEKKCRKLRMGKIQWTPELAVIRNCIRYWTLARKKCLGFKIDRKFFKRVAHSVNQPSTLNIERSVAEDNLLRARNELKLYKKNTSAAGKHG
jgi:hypothetical protein